MRISREEKAAEHFHCTTRERAAFEAGIKLAGVYHQFIGTPISASNIISLEKAIEDGIKVQPFVENASVHIRRDRLRQKRNEYDYQSLTGDMLEVDVEIKIEKAKVKAIMRYLDDIKYPLMFIESISDE